MNESNEGFELACFKPFLQLRNERFEEIFGLGANMEYIKSLHFKHFRPGATNDKRLV